jgi:hypothetical protein
LVSDPSPNPEQSDDDQLEAAADQAIATCGGDAREAIKALIVANHFLETELEKLHAAVSAGYAEESWCRVIGRIGTIDERRVRLNRPLNSFLDDAFNHAARSR